MNMAPAPPLESVLGKNIPDACIAPGWFCVVGQTRISLNGPPIRGLRSDSDVRVATPRLAALACAAVHAPTSSASSTTAPCFPLTDWTGAAAAASLAVVYCGCGSGAASWAETADAAAPAGSAPTSPASRTTAPVCPFTLSTSPPPSAETTGLAGSVTSMDTLAPATMDWIGAALAAPAASTYPASLVSVETFAPGCSAVSAASPCAAVA